MACIEKRVIRSIISLEETAPCAEAVRLMATHGIGSVGVRHREKLVGFVTDRDLLCEMAAGRGLERTSVGQAMRADMPSVSVRATDRECALIMRAERTRHLAVTDRGEIVGVVSLVDLVDLVLEEQLEEIKRRSNARYHSEPIDTKVYHERGGS